MTHYVTRPAVAGVLGIILLVVGLSSRESVAQQPAGAGGARFTGKQTMLESAQSTNLRVARGRFEAGTRSYWHSHDEGQLLFVQEGRARVQRRGEPLKELATHASDFTGPKVVHWHGASPAEAAVLTTVAFGGNTQWLEEVTDAQYRGTEK